MTHRNTAGYLTALILMGKKRRLTQNDKKNKENTKKSKNSPSENKTKSVRAHTHREVPGCPNKYYFAVVSNWPLLYLTLEEGLLSHKEADMPRPKITELMSGSAIDVRYYT